MSSIGKLFIILNLALAAAFLGWASMALAKGDAVKSQFEEEIDTLAATKAELEGSVSSLRAEVQELERGREGLRAERDQEKDRAERNKSDLDEVKRKNDQLSADIAAIQETLGGYKESIDSLNESKDRLVEQLSTAERERNEAVTARDDAERQRRDAVDSNNTAQALIAQLEKSLNSTQDQVQTLEARMSQIVSDYNISLGDVMALPDVEGRRPDRRHQRAPGPGGAERGQEPERAEGPRLPDLRRPQLQGPGARADRAREHELGLDHRSGARDEHPTGRPRRHPLLGSRLPGDTPMASRKNRASKKPAKAAKPRKSTPAPAADVEIVEESGGDGWETAVAVVTALILIAAIVCVDLQRGWYGEGLFGG